MRHCRRFALSSALLVLAAPLWAGPPKTPAPSTPIQPVLDKLIGKREVLGLTERGGKRFLGRIVSGDHGLYVVQTFHYVTNPATTTQTTTTIVTSGRKWRPVRHSTRVTTQSAVADDVAVSALLSGVAGAAYRPREESGPREMVAASDVLCIQKLSPPAKAKTAVTPPASGGVLPPAQTPSATKPASPGWTMKTLWASPDLPVPAGTAAAK